MEGCQAQRGDVVGLGLGLVFYVVSMLYGCCSMNDDQGFVAYITVPLVIVTVVILT